MGWFVRDPDWLYPIACPCYEGGVPSGYYLYAGVGEDGRQVLIFEDGQAVSFDGDGNFVGEERREPPEGRPAPRVRREGESDIDFFRRLPEFFASEEGKRSLQHQIEEKFRIYAEFIQPWFEELGCGPGTIRVKRFGLSGENIGITDLTSVDADFVDDPDSLDLNAEEREEKRREIDEWIRCGAFVLWFRGRDLWLNSDGEIEST